MPYAKLIGAGAVALIIYLGYTFVSNIVEENSILKANEAKLQQANDGLVAEKKQLKLDLAAAKIRIIEVNDKFEKAVESKNEVIRLFADHDFTKLAKRKPTLITKKMTRATAKVFKEIEDASNAE